MNSNVFRNAVAWVRISSRKPFYKFGLPFIIFMVGGSFGLKQFTSLRYQYSKKEVLKPEDLEPLGIPMKKPGEVTLETEFEKVKELDINDWENKRGPRPWEETPAAEK